MFGRRKKEEGFEWHKYVRTTLKLKREQRRQRLLDARRAAAGQIGAAGEALAVGSRAAGAAALDGAKAGVWAVGLLAQGLFLALAAAARAALGKLAVLAVPLLAALARPNIGGPIAFAGAIALGSGIGRYRGAGADGEALITLAIGVALLAAALPMFLGMTGIRLSNLRAIGVTPRTGVIGVAVALIVAGIAWVGRGGINLAPASSQLPLGPSNAVKGRAQAIGGDRLRVGTILLRLAGVEAPERQQRCGAAGAGRGWRCGAAAEAALGRLVNGRQIHCILSGSDGAGLALATCLSGETDIGAELVKRGHVFAEGGLFASYAGLERDARNAKLGIWSGGEVERPAAFRARTGKKAAATRS